MDDYDLETLLIGWGSAALGFGAFLMLLSRLH